MKKHYISPLTTIVLVNSCKMLANSTILNVNSTDLTEDVQGAVKSDSRSFSSIWDDDWSLQ